MEHPVVGKNHRLTTSQRRYQYIFLSGTYMRSLLDDHTLDEYRVDVLSDSHLEGASRRIHGSHVLAVANVLNRELGCSVPKQRATRVKTMIQRHRPS